MREGRVVLGRRTWRGWACGPLTYLDRGHALLVVGPTQAGKTSSLVVPAILNWEGPVVVTSVKQDVVSATQAWRSGCGLVQRLEPGHDDGLTWDPLEGVSGLRSALRTATSLTASSTRADAEFWNSLAVKLVAGLFVAARARAASIFDVAAVVESRRWSDWITYDPSADHDALLRSFLEYEPKTLDGVVTTAETMLLPWRFRQPLARVGAVVEGSNTLYLCSPRSQHDVYEPLFRGALRAVLERQQDQFDRGGAHRLLLVLDEAATVASLEELDQVAATVSGLRVTLVTVVQDFAQLTARWGARGATIVNNHATRVVVAGLADATVGTYLPEIVTPRGEEKVVPLRTRPRNSAVVVSGRRAMYSVHLRPWWRRRHLRDRGER